MGNLAVSVGYALSGLRAKGNVNKHAALIIPPAIPGSLGDAAMISASVRTLRNAGMAKIDLLYGNKWELDEQIDTHIAAERFFYKQSILQQMLLIARLPEYAEFYFIGADVIDGAYNSNSVCARLSLLAEAAKLGKKATLLGASYNMHPEAQTKSALRNLPESVTICARDPVSKLRMEKALDRPIRQVADLAFLLQPRADHPATLNAKNWIAIRRAAGDQIIGLNANYLHAEKDPEIISALNVFVKRVLRQSISIVLIPHDTRSLVPDEKLLQLVVNDIPERDRERIYALPPVSPGVVRAVATELDFLVTGRMHTAILALSGTTPTFCFAYQDKFEGLLQFFNLVDAGLLSSPKELSAYPEAIADKFLQLLPEQTNMRAKINEHLPNVISLAEKNFI
jgi:polysaccharide pyruvyl transferase WcaK-like protein